MPGSFGALLIPFVFHIAALIFNAAVTNPTGCEAVATFFCGSPFEAFMASFSAERDFNFFTLGLSLLSGALQSVLGIIMVDYDVFKAQTLGAWAAVGDGIRIIMGLYLVLVTLTGAMTIFRR